MSDRLSTHPFAASTMENGEDDGDHLKEECGVFGIIGDDDASAHTALGLHALQHRGQEAAGIVSFDGRQFHSHRGMGHVSENFAGDAVMERLKGDMAIGHTRYATTGETILRNVQPLFAELDSGGFSIAHNGNLTNALTLRNELKRRGCLFQSTSDTEVVIHLMAISEATSFEDRLIDALRQVEGAYSFVCLTNEALIGARAMPCGSPCSASPAAPGASPPKPARSTSSARNMSATWKRAKLCSSPATACAA